MSKQKKPIPQEPEELPEDRTKSPLLPYIALSVVRYAALTCQGVSTVYRQIAEGEIPAHKQDRRTVILVEEVLPILRGLPSAKSRTPELSSWNPSGIA